MPNFSVVLIARNEAQTLPRMLYSLKEFQGRGGEVVLIDTGSTDGTPEVARKLGCKVYEEGVRFITSIDSKLANKINRKFVVGKEEPVVNAGDKLFDYSAARNYAAGLASNNVVAMPDCDEIWTKLDIDEIDEAIKNGASRLEYNFVFSHDQFGGEAVKFMHSKFYDRTKMQWVGIIHEVLSGDCKAQYFPEDKIKLEHWQNTTTDRKGYLTGLALDCYKHPKNDRHSHYLARELFWRGRYRSSIKEFERHIAMENAWPPEKGQSIIYMGDSYIALGEEKEGLRCYHESFERDGTRREALLRLAVYYWKKNDHHHAAAYASAALVIPWTNFYANNAAEYAQLPHEILYWALWYLGDKEGSKEHWQKCIAYQPDNPKYKADAQFYQEAPFVSIVIPTLGRPGKLTECLRLIRQNAEYNNYEVIVKQDEFPPNNTGVPKLVKQAVGESKADLIMFLGNDCLPQPGFLREAVEAMLNIFPNRDGLVALNDEYWQGELATHWLASRKLLPMLGGEFFHTGYHHLGCDDELTTRCKAAGKYFWAEKSKVLHDHPLNNSKKQMAYEEIAKEDKVYNLAYKYVEQDKSLLAKRKAQGWK